MGRGGRRWALFAGTPPGDGPALRRLAEHGYAVGEAGAWRLRVPLFEQWLRRHGEE